MRVSPDPLPSSPIVRIEAMDTYHERDIYAGDTLGYWCSLCQNADETRHQIVHAADCDLAGRHGRQVYGTNLAPISGRVTGELRGETTFSLLEWGVSAPEVGIVNNEVVAFRCDQCGNLDETLFEILHDEACAMATGDRVAGRCD